MYLTVFRNRKRADLDAAAYTADNARMEELGMAMPGFVSLKSFTAEDGEVVTISEWTNRAAAKAWGHHPQHAVVQARGKADYYEGYTLYSLDDAPVKYWEREPV